jgi:hypothetical protein
MKKICVYCKKEYLTRSRKRRFCSHPCYSLSMRGKKSLLDMRGSRNPNWRGGRRIDKDGYILVHTPYHPFCSINELIWTVFSSF